MPNGRFKIVGDEFLTAIDYDDEFQVNLLFDRFIYRPMCTHIWVTIAISTVIHAPLTIILRP